MLTNTFAILLVVLAGIMLVPLLCQPIRIPSIVGFIMLGMILGPHGTNIIASTSTIEALGKLGMLYIMFQVGIDLDKNAFYFYKREAFIFGFLSFFFPFILGIFAGIFFFGYDTLSSCLLGAVFGSHTLMTYPIVSHYGIQRHSAVNIIVGGTIVSVTLSLLVLAFVKDIHLYGELQWLRMALWIAIFAFVVFYLVPIILHYIFKRSTNIEMEFMLIMLILVMSAWLAEIAGLDSILGAYLCGLALNGLVPPRSSLMERIHFMGNSLLVPLFLIGVGMIINVSAFFCGLHVLVFALIMIVIKLLGKGVSSAIITKMRHFSTTDGVLIWGMTQAASAGTLAIITIGLSLGIFEETILNSAIIMICILCTSSSFLTEHISRKISVSEQSAGILHHHQPWLLLSLKESIPNTMRELSSLVHIPETEMYHCGNWSEVYRKVGTADMSAILYKCRQPLNTIRRIVVALPKNIEKESDFIHCLDMVRRLSSQIGAPVVFYTNLRTLQTISDICNRDGRYLRYAFHEMDDWEDMLLIVKKTERDDLVILFSSLPDSPSYNPLFDEMPTLLDRFFNNINYFVIYLNRHHPHLPK